jgi:hypothetical protein
MDQDGASLTTTVRVFMGIGVVVALVIAFVIASAVACASVILESRQSAIVHSLGSWGLLSFLVGLPSLFIAMNLGLSLDIKPLIVTDINVLKTNAITTVTLGHPNKELQKLRTEPNPTTIFIAWTIFLSLTLGCAASVATAHRIYQRQSEKH